ncbi:MAG: XdhC family protein [Henriciella sp.]
MLSPNANNFEHPADVMRAVLDLCASGKRAALAIVMSTLGGSVRAPGAMMAISQEGDMLGYVSGGCIDQDVALRARQALKDSQPKALKYGIGSPFLDIRLPCGGAIDVIVLPDPDPSVLESLVALLEARQPAVLTVCNTRLSVGANQEAGTVTFTYSPKLKLRIAGRGADPVALVRLAAASGIATELWSPEEICLDQVRDLGAVTRHLIQSEALPDPDDDTQTAFVLMFHDSEWEPALLENALSGKAFYIGAVGSRETHRRRCEMLSARGVSAAAIDRIHAPIGLIPSMREASSLAVSAFAEIVSEFHSKLAAG